jgi:hypothetical protein
MTTQPTPTSPPLDTKDLLVVLQEWLVAWVFTVAFLGLATLLALFSGHLNLDAHGFGIVIFAQASWFIIAGALLWRHESQIADLPIDASQLRRTGRKPRSTPPCRDAGK